jgi:hypothetical protein
MELWEDEEIVEHLAATLKDPETAVTIMKTAKRVTDGGNEVPVVAEGADGHKVEVRYTGHGVWTFKAGRQYQGR